MTIVSSILKLHDHSNLRIFAIPFLLLLWGNLDSKYRLKLTVKKGSGGTGEKKERKLAKTIYLSSERECETFTHLSGEGCKLPGSIQ